MFRKKEPEFLFSPVCRGKKVQERRNEEKQELKMPKKQKKNRLRRVKNNNPNPPAVITASNCWNFRFPANYEEIK